MAWYRTEASQKDPPEPPGPADYLLAQDVLRWRGTTITVRTWARWPYEEQVYETEVLTGPGGPPELHGLYYHRSALGVAEEEHRMLVDSILARYFGPEDDDGGRFAPLVPKRPTP